MSDTEPTPAPSTDTPPPLPPDCTIPVGAYVLHEEARVSGIVTAYFAPRTNPDADVDAWTVVLDTRDILLWKPTSFRALSKAEAEVLGACVGGVAALFKGVAKLAQARGLPFVRTVELIAVALEAQLRALVPGTDAEMASTDIPAVLADDKPAETPPV